MSAVLSTPKTTSGGEIITNLINASDGAGLHFDGTSGEVGFTPPDLGTKFSLEFIIQAHLWPDSGRTDYIIDFGNGSDARNILGNPASGNLSILTGNGGWNSFGVKILDDLKVHHLVVTVDGTSAIAYDNGNQVGTVTVPLADIDDCTSAYLCSNYVGTGSWLNATLYRARLWNKVLSQTDVTSVYESASIDFADQWGSQTSLVDAAASVFTSGTYSWVADGSNTIANVSNTLAITYVNNASGAYNYLRNASDLTTDLTVGKKYRLTVDAKYTGGSSGARLKLNDGVSNSYSANLTTSLVNYTMEFTAQTPTGAAGYLQLDGMSASNVVTIDNWYLREIGCVADFDLAFANPTQSTIVQNRNDTVSMDGTAAGGVSQITKLEAVNTNKLNVGGTSPLVGIGLAAGSAPSYTLDVNSGAGNTAVNLVSTDASVTMRMADNATSNNKVFTRTGDNLVICEDGGNVGVGVTPSTFSSGSPAIQLGGFGHLVSANQYLYSGSNYHYNSGWKYTTAQKATKIEQADGAHKISVSSGTPVLNGTISWLDALTIDSAGTTTITPSGNVKSLDIPLSPATSAEALRVQANSLVNGKIADFTSASGDVTARSLVRILNDSGAATGTTCLEVRNDSTGKAIYANGGGIVEKDGVLKENLLSNSGFDCWSNSGLSSGRTIGRQSDSFNSGSAILDNDGSAIGSWNGSTARCAVTVSGGEFIMTDDGSGSDMRTEGQLSGLTAGALYKFSVQLENGTGTWGAATNAYVRVLNSGKSAVLATVPTQTEASGMQDYSVIWEASSATDYIVLSAEVSGGQTVKFDNVYVIQVTPGCVAADNLAFDGGYVKDSTLDIWRQHNDGGTNTKDGSFYSLKTTAGAVNDYLYWPSYYNKAEHLQRFAGRTVTLGCWVKTSTASHARVRLYQEPTGGATHVDTHTGGGGWEWLEVSMDVNAAATMFYIELDTLVSGATAYFSQPMLVFGNAIGEGNYSRPSGEIIWFDKRKISNELTGAGHDDVSATTLNAEADTNGIVPKGVKAIFFSGETNDSASSTTDTFLRLQADSTSGISFYASCAGLANDKIARASAWQACDSNGDYQYQLNASGSPGAGTLDVALNYVGVQLR